MLADFERIIRSPIKVYLLLVLCPGNHVFHGNLVAKVESSDRLIEVTLNEEEFDGIKTGLKAGVTFFSMKIHTDANVTALSHAVDSNSVRGKFISRLILLTHQSRSGVQVELKLLNPSKGCDIGTRRAIVGNFVVVEKNGKALFRDVEIGSTNLKTAEIINGLKFVRKLLLICLIFYEMVKG